MQTRDEAAFELLMWRHRHLTLSVCRRLLKHTEDAEDAFQATFLILATAAGTKSIPLVLTIDRKGVLRAINPRDLKKEVEKLLDEAK